MVLVRPLELPGDRPATAAVIGGGASGTLTAACLLRAAAAASVAVSVLLIDKDGRHGLGRAYATQHPAHLLNAPAGRMSAVPSDPGSLVRWAQAAGIAAGPGSFLARMDYGRYLQDTLADAERAAAPASSVRRLTAEVIGLTTAGQATPGQATADQQQAADLRSPAARLTGSRRARAADRLPDLAEPQVRVHLVDGRHLDADVAVLATGSLPPAAPCPVPATPRYVADPWSPGALDRVADGSPVLILGTGLTMLDVAVAVTGSRPDSIVYAISRHALLPREHRQHGSQQECAENGGPGAIQGLTDGHRDLAGLIRRVRAEAGQSAAGWQPVVDALRPHSQQIWQQLREREQRMFLRHVARYWEVHRHRVPPATASRIDALRVAGRLRVLRGRVSQVTADGDRLTVLVEQGSAGVAAIRTGWLVNGTGPGTDVCSTRDRLLRQLLDAGLAAPDPHRLGIRTDGHGAVITAAGQPSSWLYALGPLLRGQLYETTAIPEIRDQASALASRLVALAAPQHAA